MGQFGQMHITTTPEFDFAAMQPGAHLNELDLGDRSTSPAQWMSEGHRDAPKLSAILTNLGRQVPRKAGSSKDLPLAPAGQFIPRAPNSARSSLFRNEDAPERKAATPRRRPTSFAGECTPSAPGQQGDSSLQSGRHTSVSAGTDRTLSKELAQRTDEELLDWSNPAAALAGFIGSIGGHLVVNSVSPLCADTMCHTASVGNSGVVIGSLMGHTSSVGSSTGGGGGGTSASSSLGVANSHVHRSPELPLATRRDLRGDDRGEAMGKPQAVGRKLPPVQPSTPRQQSHQQSQQQPQQQQSLQQPSPVLKQPALFCGGGSAATAAAIAAAAVAAPSTPQSFTRTVSGNSDGGAVSSRKTLAHKSSGPLRPVIKVANTRPLGVAASAEAQENPSSTPKAKDSGGLLPPPTRAMQRAPSKDPGVTPRSHPQENTAMRVHSKEPLVQATPRVGMGTMRLKSVDSERVYYKDVPDLRELAVRYSIGQHIDLSLTDWRHEHLEEVFYKRMREAFTRFLSGSCARHPESLLRSFTHLGFACSSPKQIAAIESQFALYDEVDFMTFTSLMRWYAETEYKDLQAKFSKCQLDESDTMDVRQLDTLMRSVGIVVSRRDVEALLPLTFPSVMPRRITFDMFSYMVAAFRSVEGFTSDSDLDRLSDAFAAMDESGLGELPVSKLRGGLLRFFGPSALSHIRELIGSKISDTVPSVDGTDEEAWQWPYSPGPVSSREFLVWARKVRELERETLWTSFKSADMDGSGYIDREELKGMMEGLGFTPLQNVVEGFLVEASGQQEASELDFEDFMKLLEAVQARQGFTKSEQDAWVDAFELFREGLGGAEKHKSGEESSEGIGGREKFIASYGVLRLLRWCGFNPEYEALAHLIKEEDVQGNGLFSSMHFMRLMRRYREADIVRFRQAYAGAGPMHKWEPLPMDRIHDMLVSNKALDFPVTEQELDAAVADCPPTFDTVVCAIDQCRQAYAESRRKRAGFSEEEAQIIEMAFNEVTSGDTRGLRVQEHMPWLLAHLGAPMQSKAQRTAMLEGTAVAYRAARAAKCDGAKPHEEDSPFMKFGVLLHMLRHVAELGERDRVEKEMRMVMQCNFSAAEVQEFREVFKMHADSKEVPQVVELTRRNSLYLTARSRTTVKFGSGGDTTEIAESGGVFASMNNEKYMILRPSFEIVKMSKEAFWNLLSSTNMPKGDSSQNSALARRVDEVVDSNQRVDFADFLRLMRWVLDKNYGDIKSKAAQTLLE